MDFGLHHAQAHVGAQRVDALGVVAEEQVRGVEHGVDVEVEVVELLLVEPVAIAVLAREALTGGVDARLRGALDGEAAVSEAHSDARREPLADGHVHSRSQALAELHLLVVVAEVEKAVRLDLELVRAVFHRFGEIAVLHGLRLLRHRRTRSRHCQGGQHCFLNHIVRLGLNIFSRCGRGCPVAGGIAVCGGFPGAGGIAVAGGFPVRAGVLCLRHRASQVAPLRGFAPPRGFPTVRPRRGDIHVARMAGGFPGAGGGCCASGTGRHKWRPHGFCPHGGCAHTGGEGD